jgi:hypothetical protein
MGGRIGIQERAGKIGAPLRRPDRLGLSRDGLRPPASPRGGAPGHAAGAGVAQIGFLCAAPGIRKAEAHRRTLSFVDFLSTTVTDEHCLSSHDYLPVVSVLGSTSVTEMQRE